jgi:hypothetical protein
MTAELDENRFNMAKDNCIVRSLVMVRSPDWARVRRCTP